MSKPRRRIIYAIAVLVILAIVLTIVYRSFRQVPVPTSRSPRVARHDAATVADGQMLKGNFGSTVSKEQREIVMAELHAPDQAYPAPTSAPGVDTRTGKQQIVLTQPLGTTVQDTQPTLTWDVRTDGWSYWVHVEDRDSHQTVAISPALDEAIWRIPSPLPRGHSYLWRVEASPGSTRTAATTTTSPTAQFSVLSDEGEKEIEDAKASNASHLLLGSLYTHYGMWRDAVLEYRALVDSAPDSPDAIKLLRNAEIRSNAQLAAGVPR
jgi:hypothetical protein